MTQYIVTADTYTGFGCEIYFFGVFNTQEEAINWIINNPIQEIDGNPFDFFREYENFKEVDIYEESGLKNPQGLRMRRLKVGERIMPKEEYAEKFIHPIVLGKPIFLGGYWD